MVFIAILQRPRAGDFSGILGIWAHESFLGGFGALKIAIFDFFCRILLLQTSEIEASLENSFFVQVRSEIFRKIR